MIKIIVLVDFSEYSENALKVAATLAKAQNAELIAVHMMGMSDAVFSKDGTTSMSSLGEIDEEPSFESRASTEDERF